MGSASKSHVKGYRNLFSGTDLSLARARALVIEGLKGADYGELFVQRYARESFDRAKGEFSGISPGDRFSGFGFRFGAGNQVGYAYSDEISLDALQRCITKARRILDEMDKPPEGRAESATYGRSSRHFYSYLKY